LTGDKKETAINIGYSCKLLSDQLLNLTLDETTLDVSQSIFQFNKSIEIFFLKGYPTTIT
jgi:magnesium-transporting ATPase (P-type)